MEGMRDDDTIWNNYKKENYEAWFRNLNKYSPYKRQKIIFKVLQLLQYYNIFNN